MAITASVAFDSGHGSSFVIAGDTVSFTSTTDGISNSWFYVKLSGVDGTTPVINCTYESPMSMTGIRPVYSFDNSTWVDVSSTWASPVLSFTLPAISGYNDVWIAASIPYTYAMLQADIDIWDNSTSLVSVEILGLSPSGLNMYYVKIEDMTSTYRKAPIVITCRTHPAEPPSSWELKGMIDWLISSDATAILLRKLAVFHIFPMINPDGVYGGLDSAFLSGTNANRNYDESGPNESTEETETYLVHSKIHSINASTTLAFHLDLHASLDAPNVWRDSVELDASLEEKAEGWLSTYDTVDFWNPAFQQHANLAISVDTTWRDGMHDQYNINSWTNEGKILGYGAFGFPTASAIQAGGVSMIKSILRALSEFLLPCGFSWGDSSSIPQKPEPWSGWEVKETGADATDSGDYDELQLTTGQEFVSPVMDLLTEEEKFLTVSYSTWSGSGTIQWRGRGSIFNQADDETDGPAWEAYVGKTSKTWQYVQIKVTG